MEAKNLLKSMLEKRAAEDALFAEAMSKASKNIDDCWRYVMSEARKMATGGCACVADDEVMNWAIHYYDEDDIKLSSTNVAEKVRTVAVEQGLREADVKNELSSKVEQIKSSASMPVQKKSSKKTVDESLFVGSLFG